MELRKHPYTGTSRPGPVPPPPLSPLRPGTAAVVVILLLVACVALVGLGAPAAAVPTVAVSAGLGAVEIVRRLYAALHSTMEPE